MMRYPISALACVLTVTESSILGGIQGVFYTCLLCVLKPSSRFPRAQSDVFLRWLFSFVQITVQKQKPLHWSTLMTKKSCQSSHLRSWKDEMFDLFAYKLLKWLIDKQTSWRFIFFWFEQIDQPTNCRVSRNMIMLHGMPQVCFWNPHLICNNLLSITVQTYYGRSKNMADRWCIQNTEMVE